MMLGNRGGRFHDPATRRLTGRRFASKRWICCELTFKDRRRAVFGHGYTELFFLDEATALAAVRVAAMYWSANGGEESLARLTRAAIDSLGKGLVDPGPVLGESRAPAERLRASTGHRSQSRQAK